MSDINWLCYCVFKQNTMQCCKFNEKTWLDINLPKAVQSDESLKCLKHFFKYILFGIFAFINSEKQSCRQRNKGP